MQINSTNGFGYKIGLISSNLRIDTYKFEVGALDEASILYAKKQTILSSSIYGNLPPQRESLLPYMRSKIK